MVRRGTERSLILALSAFICAAALVFLAFAPAAYAYTFDTPAGEPISVTDGVYYDPQTRDFVFEANGGNNQIHCSVLDGMVVSSPVTIKGSGVFLYRNGAEYSGSLEPVSEPGEYVVMLNAGERSSRILTFTIAGKTTNYVTTYNMPAGMIVNQVFFNDEEISADYRSVSMDKEGTYRVITECIASGVVYTLETTVDRTPPELVFSGRSDRRGRYNSAVTISGVGSGEKLNCTKDGEEYRIEVGKDGTARLTQSGNYDIVAYDEAGNISEYPILIMAYLNTSGAAFVALLLFILAAVIIYIAVKRRKLRIG